jgi:hypothetical protein
VVEAFFFDESSLAPADMRIGAINVTLGYYKESR